MYGRNDDDNDYACDNNTRKKIKLKLLDIQDVLDLNNIDCQFHEQNIDIGSINFKEAQTRLEIYANISKLSIYLMNDYDFFSKVSIQSAFMCPVYNTAMQNLGYQRQRSTWTLFNKPSQDTIIENIFKYCFYSYIVKVKRKEQTYPEPRNRNVIKPFNSGDYRNYERDNQSPHRNRQNFRNEERNQPPFRKQNQPNYQKKPSFHEDNYQHRSRYEERTERSDRNQQDKQGFQDNYQKPMPKDNEPVNLPKKPPVKPPEYKEIIDKWKCKVCETMNFYGIPRCETCDTKGPALDQWSCYKCTFLNEPNSFNCSICGNINENIIDARGLK